MMIEDNFVDLCDFLVIPSTWRKLEKWEDYLEHIYFSHCATYDV